MMIHWQEKGLVYGFETQSKMVHEKRKCLRCGVKFKRRLVPNPDGTLSCIGWDPDTEPEKEDQ